MAKYKRTIHKFPLTDEQKTFATEMARLRDATRIALREQDDHRKKCNHSMAYEHDTIFGFGSTWCQICDKHFGWYCPDSPDHSCHYYTEQSKANYGKIKLTDGSMIGPPNQEHNPSFETNDDCLFCHAPEERK